MASKKRAKEKKLLINKIKSIFEAIFNFFNELMAAWA
jgi:hypothetical protein